MSDNQGQVLRICLAASNTFHHNKRTFFAPKIIQMKALNLNLILRHFFAIVLMTTATACSFKKDPEKDKKQVVMVKRLDALNEEPDNLMNSVSEEKFLEVLDGRSVQNLENIKSTKGESLLDIAIRLKKAKILRYLLEKEFNPFLYSQTSSELLELNSKYKEMIRTFQMPVLYDVAGSMSKLIESNELDQKLQVLHFQAHACVSLISLILDARFYTLNYEAGDYVRDYSISVDPIIGVKAIFGSKACSLIRDKVPNPKISKWVADEIVYQRFLGFHSVDLLNLLLELGSVEDIAIEAYENGHKLRIEPMAMFESNSSKVVDSERKKWTTLLQIISSKDLYYYNLTVGSHLFDDRIRAIFDSKFDLYKIPSDGVSDE